MYVLWIAHDRYTVGQPLYIVHTLHTPAPAPHTLHFTVSLHASTDSAYLYTYFMHLQWSSKPVCEWGGPANIYALIIQVCCHNTNVITCLRMQHAIKALDWPWHTHNFIHTLHTIALVYTSRSTASNLQNGWHHSEDFQTMIAIHPHTTVPVVLDESHWTSPRSSVHVYALLHTIYCKTSLHVRTEANRACRAWWLTYVHSW